MAQRPSNPSPERDWLARLDASITPARLGKSVPQVSRPPEPMEVAAPHPASLDAETLFAQCDLTRGRAGGPGGQHRNKVETLVRIHHRPTGVESHAGERRSVAENKREALWRLRLTLAVCVRCPVGVGDVRSELWRSRSSPARAPGSAGRIVVSPMHDDYPALLAEALDMVWACPLDLKVAAARLGCSASQLLKLIKDHPPAWVFLNAHRVARGMHAMK